MKVSGVNAQARLNFAASNLTKNKKTDDSQSPKPISNEPASAPTAKPAHVNFTSIHKTNRPAAVINFGGTKNKDQVLFVVAEHKKTVGGVATVAKDFETFTDKDKEMIWSPYHNGQIKYDPKTGEEKGVSVLKTADGKFIYTDASLKTQSIDDYIKEQNKKEQEIKAKDPTKNFNKNYTELEEIITPRKMPFAEEEVNIGLYKVKGTNHYMVFTDTMAKMPEPYALKGFNYSSVADDAPRTWKGDAYAELCKAVVELLPEVEKYGFAPETVICNDAQTAFVPEFMAQKNIAGDAYYQGVKPTHVTHNMGKGTYTGPTSFQNMATSFMNKEQINAVRKDPEYIKAIHADKTEKYFQKFFSKDMEAANATLIPLLHRKNDYVAALTTVAEVYADKLATNPKKTEESVYGLWKELYNQKKVGGIMNPFNNESFSIHKKIGQDGYNQPQEVLNSTTGQKETIPAFQILKENATYEEMKVVKNANKKNLFYRVSGHFNTPEAIGTIIAGVPGKIDVSTIGHIDKKWIEKIDKGEDVKVFTSWGRADLQKGLDTVVEAFEKHCKEKGSENSVLIFGGPLKQDDDSKKVREQVKNLIKDKNFEGRVVLIDGFAPNAPLSSASDAAVFASRFEPCGLTDLEALRFYCTPIVANTDGLSQKNPDPRIASEAEKATSYKTTNEFFMSDETLKAKSPKFTEAYNKMLAIEKASCKNKGLEDTLEIGEDKVKISLDEFVAKTVKDTDAYKDLERKHLDNIMSDELAEAMNAFATKSEDTARLLYKNQVALDSRWKTNGALHPSGKSSRQLYQEIHLDPTPQKATKSLFNFDSSKIGITPKITPKGIEEDKKGLSKLLSTTGGKIGAGVAAVAVLGGLGVYFSKSKKPANINADGDAFQRNSLNKNNKAKSKHTGASNKRLQAQRQEQNLQRA